MKIKKYQKPSGPLKPAKVYLDGKWVELESHGGGELSAGGRQFKVNSKPKSATGNKEIVVTPKGNTIINKEDLKPKPVGYSSAFHSEDTIPFINTLTLGGLNNLSPTQWIRRAYDTKELLSGNMDWSNYTNSWINGNNGIVSDQFAEKHPYWSTGINLAGDVATGIGILKPGIAQEVAARTSGVTDAVKYGIKDRIQGYQLYNKYLKNNIDNISDQLQDFTFDNGWIRTSDKSGSIFLQPATYTRSEVISSGPTSMRMGFTANPGGKLSRNLVTQGKEAIDKLPAGTSISADSHGISIPSRLSTRRGQKNITKTLFEGVENSETTLSKLEERVGEEFSRNPYDMSADAHRFFTLEAQKPGRQLVYAGRSGKWNNAAVSNPEIYQWQQAYENGTLSARDYVNNYNNWVKQFGGRPGHVDIKGKPYFYHPTVFITHKQGGKLKINNTDI